MFADDDLLPLSALQHLLFCERQCALIHVEQLWAENALTVEGQHLHKKADAGRADTRNRQRTTRGIPLRSYRLGLIGKADVVEFPNSGADAPLAPFPVEYKRGKPKAHDADRVQLCAQALCLEEMLAVSVPAGALFYGETRRRLDVPFDASLRALTEETCRRLHDMIVSGVTPPAVREPKCDRCSLIHLCLPESLSKSASGYLARVLGPSAAGAPATRVD